jgi:DnaD/phage-associated family protein
MRYYIDWENADGAAAIPLSARDGLKNARPKAAKWLLYTLLTNDFGIESSAEALGMDVDDTEEALRFWQDRGVVSGGKGTDNLKKTKSDTNDKRVDVSHAKYDFLRPKDKKEITDIVAHSPELTFLFAQIQRIVPGDPTFTEQKALIFMHEYYGISVNCILMLIDFAVSIGKYQNRSPAYVDYVAKDWASRGIFDYKEAADDIARLRAYYTFEGRIAAIFDVKRPFTAKEREYIAKWTEFDFFDEVYHYAYEITVEYTGTLRFPYLSKVLQSWHDKDLRNLDEIKAFNEKYLADHADYNSFSSGKQKKGTQFSGEKQPKSKGTPSFDLTNAADDDLAAAIRGELG